MAENKRSNTKQFLVDFLTGGTAGAVAKTVCAPLERVKLLLQTQKDNVKLDPSKKYKGIGDAFVRCVREEGTLSLWRGNWANVLRYFPTQAIAFSVKDQINRNLNPYNPKKEPMKFFFGSLLAGGTAGSISLLFVYPLDFARTRLGVDLGRAASERQFNGLTDCCVKIFKSDGIQGLYRGFGISVVGIFTYRAFYFGGYDAGKKFIWGESGQKDASFLARFAFAQIITSSSETLAYPLDTVRRRLMMQSGRVASGGKLAYSGTIDCFQKIYRAEGIRGFFSGNLSNVWRSVGSSLVLVLYDEFQKIVNPHKKH